VQVRFGSTWYSYLTSVLEPQQLPPFAVADLYHRRWRIEEAFCTVKRLLGLSYLWTGSINGIKLQIWATWLFYAVLVDLGDAVADEVGVPFEQISLEMLYRDLYHFSVAINYGKATNPVAYFTAPENQDLRVIKIRKPKAPLDLSPFPKFRLTFASSFLTCHEWVKAPYKPSVDQTSKTPTRMERGFRGRLKSRSYSPSLMD